VLGAGRWALGETLAPLGSAGVRVALGTDELTPLVEEVKRHLESGGHEVDVVAGPPPGPRAGRLVGEAVASGRCEAGVVCCWTGTGVSIAANKVDGVRAALCVDAATASGARKWNDANVLALSLRLTSAEVAREILDAFMTTAADPSEADTVAELN
jgi:ribose 5-phosphate isomerase B